MSGQSTLGSLIVSKTAWLASMMTSFIRSMSNKTWGGGSSLIFRGFALIGRSLTEVVGALLQFPRVVLWRGEGFG